MRMFFFFNDAATTEIYTLSLHDALPIYNRRGTLAYANPVGPDGLALALAGKLKRDYGIEVEPEQILLSFGAASGLGLVDRKSTRLNSSHANISYAVFCLKKKKCKQRVLD